MHLERTCKMSWLKRFFCILAACLLLAGCKKPSPEHATMGIEEREEMKTIRVNVNGEDFTAEFENNQALNELCALLQEGDLTLHLRDYAGFEKVGPLGRRLTANNQQTTTEAGDIVLYNGNQIVIFYGSNSWSYTRIGHITDLNGWSDALGSGDATVVFAAE